MGALFSGGGTGGLGDALGSMDNKDMLASGLLGMAGGMMGGPQGMMMGLIPMLMQGLLGGDEEEGKPSESMRGQHDFMDRTGMSRSEYKDTYGQKGYQQEINKQADQTGFMPSDYELMDKGYAGYGSTPAAPKPQPTGVGMANNQDAGQIGTEAQKPFNIKGLANDLNEMAKSQQAMSEEDAKRRQALQAQMAKMPSGLMAQPQGGMPTTPPTQGAAMGVQAGMPSNAMQAIQGGLPAGVGMGAQPNVHELMKRFYGR